MPYCRYCGSETGPDSGYCPKCGAPVGGETIGEEIGREIGQSIRDSIFVESIPEVKLIDSLFGGCVVVLIGAVLYLAASGKFTWLNWGNFWAYFLFGIGVLLLAKGLLEFFIRPARSKAYGDINGGVVLGLIGGTVVFILAGGDWSKDWPIFLVVVGIVVVAVAVVTYAAQKIAK